MKSILEERFSHVVQRLSDCWGDPYAFTLLHRELMFDTRGTRTGWPMEAWQELTFLMELHDLAYGSAQDAGDAWSESHFH
ncbi:MAG: hypothetical protein U9Q81_19225 [Pseudomonadota bacterium]|nr:hypothetical protein [Pseudomonadota bacterium]